jgi:hypothetical protein
MTEQVSNTVPGVISTF